MTNEARTRAVVMVRASVLNCGLCEVCGIAEARDMAHRLARSRGGAWTPSNILALCRRCHDGQRDGRGGEALATRLGQVLPGMVDGAAPDPAAVPVQTVYGRVFLNDNGDVAPVLKVVG